MACIPRRLSIHNFRIFFNFAKISTYLQLIAHLVFSLSRSSFSQKNICGMFWGKCILVMNFVNSDAVKTNFKCLIFEGHVTTVFENNDRSHPTQESTPFGVIKVRKATFQKKHQLIMWTGRASKTSENVFGRRSI